MDGALSNTMRWFSLISLWKLIIAHSLGTDSCINATCRFVFRRGQVTTVPSDTDPREAVGKPESDKKKYITPSYQRASGQPMGKTNPHSRLRQQSLDDEGEVSCVKSKPSSLIEQLHKRQTTPYITTEELLARRRKPGPRNSWIMGRVAIETLVVQWSELVCGPKHSGQTY